MHKKFSYLLFIHLLVYKIFWVDPKNKNILLPNIQRTRANSGRRNEKIMFKSVIFCKSNICSFTFLCIGIAEAKFISIDPCYKYINVQHLNLCFGFFYAENGCFHFLLLLLLYQEGFNGITINFNISVFLCVVMLLVCSKCIFSFFLLVLL